MSERFYISCPLSPGPIELEGAEARHLAQVCRLRPGDAVILFNGDGQEYHAVIEEVQRRHVALDVRTVEQPQRELPFFLEIAAPLPKGDRAQFMIEKLTELGASSFVPLDTERSVITPREGKMEKLERYVIEASKQCGRNVLMQIAPLTGWRAYAAPRSDEECRVLLDREGADAMPVLESSASLRIAVGPEGGFTDVERDLAEAQGWRFVSLGQSVLRIETAALAAVVLAAAGRRSHIH
jgi:16S rRNA (uracil1498-N3)-methyltransferase